MFKGAPPGMSTAEAVAGTGVDKNKRKSQYNLKDICEKETLKKYFFLSPINRMYHLYQITTMFAKKTLWVLSCLGLMYGFPMMLEYMGE